MFCEMKFLVSGTNLTAIGFNIQNCTACSGHGAIIIKSKSRARFYSVRIGNNINRALFVEPKSYVMVEDSCFKNNKVDNQTGGVIHGLSYISLEITNSFFSGEY